MAYANTMLAFTVAFPKMTELFSKHVFATESNAMATQSSVLEHSAIQSSSVSILASWTKKPPPPKSRPQTIVYESPPPMHDPGMV